MVNDRIIKSNETLRMVKTNKEYQLLLREVDDNKKRKNSIEDHLLTLYEQREAAEVKLKETEAQYVQLKEQIQPSRQRSMSGPWMTGNSWRNWKPGSSPLERPWNLPC